MAIKLKCRCGERLSAPESAVGKKGKCSKCGMTFVIPAPMPTVASATPKPVAKPAAKPAAKPLDEDDFGLSDFGGGPTDLEGDLDDFLAEETPNPFQSPTTISTPAASPMKSTGNTPAQMNTLANGIKLVFWGTVTTVLSLIIAFFAGIFLPPLVLVAGGVALLGAALCTVGRITCLGGPSKAGGKALLIAAVLCDLAYISINVVVIFGLTDPRVGNFGSLFNMATWMLFVLFVKKVMTSVGKSQLADEARTIVLLVAISIVLLIAIPVASLTVPLLSIVAAFGLLGVGLAAFLKYVNLLQHAGEALRR